MAGRRGKPRSRRKGSADVDIYAGWISHIRSASKNSAVVVGHKKEADILAGFGVKHVYYLKEPYFRFIETLMKLNKECILLFDATHSGNVDCERVASDLLQHGIKVNTRFRKMLFTSACKELGGLLAFIHKHIAITPRTHEALPERL
ncbi:MAG: hypothetical protein QXK08_03665 [Candidatus Woesearchaeota archaeon]